MISVKLIKHTQSTSNAKAEVATFQLVYPLFIHAQLLKHHAFASNSASARAIPSKTLIEWVKSEPTAPRAFRLNQAGMQAGEDLMQTSNEHAHAIWNEAMINACNSVEQLTSSKLNVHKQWANRLLMPFMHISTILTGSEFENFFDLRVGKPGDADAQEEIDILATEMSEALKNSTPVRTAIHIPFAPESYPSNGPGLISTVIRAVAKMSRESYMRTDKVTTLKEDCEQIIRLAGGKRLHASPFEHVAFMRGNYNLPCDEKLGSGNLHRDFVQLRHSGTLLSDMIEFARVVVKD